MNSHAGRNKRAGGCRSRSGAEWNHLKIVLNALSCDRLRDDDDVPLDLEADQDLEHN